MSTTPPFLASLLAFLFQYPSRVFEQGVFVWQGAGWARLVVPAVGLLIVVAGWSYLRAGRVRPGCRPSFASRWRSTIVRSLGTGHRNREI